MSGEGREGGMRRLLGNGKERVATAEGEINLSPLLRNPRKKQWCRKGKERKRGGRRESQSPSLPTTLPSRLLSSLLFVVIELMPLKGGK